ncbi:hypothetical protein [Alteromonas sp. a30]|uniref:hypothetical protein n=1 Tax=Alteromonas sp. a30 TaxID=2730917 RepID=UPI0022830DB0|nr:hypothetical protein [Alteromonas sp. a30]MCY7296526.1 hypothetical protein [Alteromonas sp. a30]
MEISGSNNTAVAAFQANVSATSAAQESRPLQETSSAGQQQSSSDQVSISSEARSLFESEQGGSQANSGRSSDY